MKVESILIGFLLVSSQLIAQSESDTQEFSFNRSLWNSSAGYRMKVIEQEFFDSLIVKSRSEIIDILGPPDTDEENTIGYCLEFESVEDLENGCELSIIFINFAVSPRDKNRCLGLWIGG